MARAIRDESTEFFRSTLRSPEGVLVRGWNGPYDTKGMAKSIATRSKRWGYKDYSTVIQQLTAGIDESLEPYLYWEDVDVLPQS